MTRSEKILKLYEELVVTDYQGKNINAFSKYPVMGYGALGAATAIGVAHGVHKAHAQTREKIRQTGLGPEHSQAQSRLKSLRAQHALALGMSPVLRAKIYDQKAKVRDVENRGLERYHKGLTEEEISPSLLMNKRKTLP